MSHRLLHKSNYLKCVATKFTNPFLTVSLPLLTRTKIKFLWINGFLNKYHRDKFR